MKKKYRNEFMVGIFFLICLTGLLYLTFSTGKVHVREVGYNIHAVFDDVSGLGKNSPVMVNGLEVGRVQDIKVSYEEGRTKVILKLLIRKDIKIWDNSVVSIKTLGLMGEKFIHISSSEGTEFLKPGAVLAGKPFTDMDALMEKAYDISGEIQGLVGNVNNLTDEVRKLAKNLNYTVEGSQDRITQILKNLEVASKNFEEFSDDIKRHPWKLLIKTKEKKTKEKKTREKKIIERKIRRKKGR